jgi:hypothetical protein
MLSVMRFHPPSAILDPPSSLVAAPPRCVLRALRVRKIRRSDPVKTPFCGLLCSFVANPSPLRSLRVLLLNRMSRQAHPLARVRIFWGECAAPPGLGGNGGERHARCDSPQRGRWGHAAYRFSAMIRVPRRCCSFDRPCCGSFFTVRQFGRAGILNRVGPPLLSPSLSSRGGRRGGKFGALVPRVARSEAEREPRNPGLMAATRFGVGNCGSTILSICRRFKKSCEPETSCVEAEFRSRGADIAASGGKDFRSTFVANPSFGFPICVNPR